MPAPTRGLFSRDTYENTTCLAEENLSSTIARAHRSSVIKSGARSSVAVNCRRGRRKSPVS